MYYCPVCKAAFSEKEGLTRHFLSCWKQKNPNHKSKDAPRSEDKESQYVTSEIDLFFKAFGV